MWGDEGEALGQEEHGAAGGDRAVRGACGGMRRAEQVGIFAEGRCGSLKSITHTFIQITYQ